MFCKKCGKQIDSDSFFCAYCGASQKEKIDPPNNNTDENTTRSEQVIPISLHNTLEDSIRTEKDPKYDLTYKNYIPARYIGLTILVINLIVLIKYGNSPKELINVPVVSDFLWFLTILLRVVIMVWVGALAEEQNRNRIVWMIFGFLTPVITLIIISFTKKRYAKFKIDTTLSAEKNSTMLSSQAHKYYKKKRYVEAIRFAEKSIQLNPENGLAKDVIFHGNKEKEAEEQQQAIALSKVATKRKMRGGGIMKILTESNKEIGSKVLIDDLPAQDGTYIFNSQPSKVLVENGKIKKILFTRKYGKVIIEMQNAENPTLGDSAFLKTGEPAPTGTYSTPFFGPKIIVTNGKFIRIED